MKELKWREGMTIEEKMDAGFGMMTETFKEVFRRMDLQKDEMNDFRRFMSQKLVEINGRFDKVDNRLDKMDGRFDKIDSKMDGVLRTLRNHDEDIAVLQKVVGQK